MEQELLNKLKLEHKKLQEQIDELNSQMREKSKDLMKEAFRNFFTSYDSVVENVFWTQYTPYFNDGETCHFGVGDMCITLKGAVDADGDFEEFEGSEIYDEDDINDLKEKIAAWEAWELDPMGEAQKYKQTYVERFNRNPFEPNTYRRYEMKSSEEQLMREWRPHYVSKEHCQTQLQLAQTLVSSYPNLKNDFEDIATMIAALDENLMQSMFGDHVLVRVSPAGIETEHHDHH
jgi:hypothetical protein